MRYWLARMPFTFLVLAAWLVYEGYRASKQDGTPAWRIAIYFLAAVLSFSLSMMAFKERHRPKGDD